MKKLFLLVALTGAAVAAYCVTPANASTTEAQQAKADVYKMSSNLVILPEYGASGTVYILKNGRKVSRDTDWSLDAQPFNFDVQPSGTGSAITLTNMADNPDNCWGYIDVYINSGTIYVGRVYVNKIY